MHVSGLFKEFCVKASLFFYNIYTYILLYIMNEVEIDGYKYHPDYDGKQIPVFEERENVSIMKRIVLSPGDLFDLNFRNNVEVRLSKLLNV